MIEILLTIAGIVLPSLLVFLAVRRWFEPVSWRIGAILLALVFLFTARGVFTSQLPVPLDEVARGYPYRGIVGDVTTKNYLTNDTTKQILPWMHVVREELFHGRLPLWNRYQFSGYPLLGNGQSAPFAPVFLATLFVPLPKQIVAMAGVKLFLALLFGYLLLRREKLGDGAALFGSAAFAFALFNNCFLYYPMTAVSLLMPAAAYATVVALERRGRAPLVLLAIVVASLLAGGHPESAVHVVLGVLAFVAIEAFAPLAQRFTWRAFVRVTIAAILGVIIAAPSWVPVLEQVIVSTRVAALESGPGFPPLPKTILWALANPDGFGNPAHQNYNWWIEYPVVASIYFGLIVLVLLPGALLSRRALLRDRLVAIAAIVFFLVAMRWTFVGDLFYAMPPLSWVAHERLAFVACFFAAIAAARATQRLRGDDLVLALLSTLVAIGFVGYLFSKLLGRTLTWWSLAGVVALILFWLGALAMRRRPAAVGVLAAILTLVELLVLGFDYNAPTERRLYTPRLPILEALARSAPPEPYRVLGYDWTFLPNAAAQYGLEDVRGSDPMQWADYARFFQQIEVPKDPDLVKRVTAVDHPLVDFLNVRFLLTEPGHELGGKWRRVYSGPDGELFENSAALPRFFAPEPAHGTEIVAWMDRPTKYKLRIRTPVPALIASSQPAMKWWRVRVDGRPAEIVRIHGAFIGFRVPAGESRVIVDYHPRSFYAAMIASAAGLVALVLFVVRVGRSGAERADVAVGLG